MVPAQTSTLEVRPLMLIVGRLNPLKSNLILRGRPDIAFLNLRTTVTDTLDKILV